MGIETGLFGLILLGLNIWAILKIVESSVGAGVKAIWIVLILVLPVLGFIIWLLFGPRG
jgi:hypothetical protein